jgi:hypothetical protein
MIYPWFNWIKGGGCSLIVAVVPAMNEAGRISRVLNELLKLPVAAIICVVNGSHDQTLEEATSLKNNRVKALHFKEPLGIDLPRAVGAKFALDLGAQKALFVDGDMIGISQKSLAGLCKTLDQGVDMALTNCYPGATHRYSFANRVLYFRHLLNETTGIFSQVGLASPAHGPHAVSRRLLLQVPLAELAIPPVAMVMALQAGLSIGLGAIIPHLDLASAVRNSGHGEKVGDTLIGDCLEAIHLWRGEPRKRSWGGYQFLGYHPMRRWDLLEGVMHQPPSFID